MNDCKLRKNNSIAINATLNIIKSCLSIVFPLITYPIILHKLGTVGVGKVSYVHSIIAYFAMLAMLGVSTYAVREGAVLRNDKNKLKNFVSEVLTINVLATTISYILLTLFVLLVGKLHSYYLLFIISGFDILFRTFAIDWINTIFEDYLFITLRSIGVYIISFILIVFLIKSPDDYWIYAILTVVPNGIICISNFAYCRKYVDIGLTKTPNLKKHLKPLIILFFNAIMVSIYVNFDSTMLGWIKGDHYVGLYSLSVRVYTVLKNLLVAVYAVSTARLSIYAGTENWKEFKNLFSKITSVLSLLLIPVSIGIISLADEIVHVFGGTKYIESVTSLKILAVSLIFSIFSGLVTSCMDVPLKREKDLLMASSISAAINCGLNFVFIPWMGCNGAAITTVISELFVFCFCFIRIPIKEKCINYSIIGHNIIDALCGAVIIIVYSNVIRLFLDNVIIKIIVIVCGSVILYGLFLLIRKNEFLFAAIKKITQKVRRA